MLIISQTKSVLLNMKNIDSLYIEEGKAENELGITEPIYRIVTITKPQLILLWCKKRETAENFLEEIAKTFCNGKTKLLCIPEYISESEE